MGAHRIAGVFKGLGKKKRPAVKITISGELDKAPTTKFRNDLKKLARKYGLAVTAKKISK